MDDTDEILPYEEFEDEIQRARTSKKTTAATTSTSKEMANEQQIKSIAAEDSTSNKGIVQESEKSGKELASKDDANQEEEAVEQEEVDDGDKKRRRSSNNDTGSTVISLSHITARPEPQSSPKLPTPKAAVPGPCFDFQKGVCFRGESCRWSHAALVPVSARPFNSAFNVPKPAPELTEEEKAKRSRRVQKFGVSQAENKVAAAPSAGDEEVLKNRIKRFGEVVPTASVSPASVDPDLLAKAQADPVDLTAVARPAALHICGTWLANKKTKQILEFFGDYAPSHVEWIDLYSCNVVFNDNANTRRALIACSHPPDLQSALTPEQQTQATALNITETTLSSWVWRLAFASRSAAVLLMRLATEKDVKIHPAERKGFSQYFSQHIAPQFPSEVPKLVKVDIPVESLVDDADLKATIEAKEMVDEKGRTIRGRGLKVSGHTRGIGPLYVDGSERVGPVVTMPAKTIIKQEPEVDEDEDEEDETPVKSEESEHPRKQIQLKGGDPAKRKRIETIVKAKDVQGVRKKRLLVTKRGEELTLRSSPDRAMQRERDAINNRSSISPHSRNKKPKKIITSRRLRNNNNNSPSPSSERRSSLSPAPSVSRNKLRMDARSRSRSFSPAVNRKTAIASSSKSTRTKRSPSSRSFSPAGNRKTISTRKNVPTSRSRSPVAPRANPRRSLSQSPLRNYSRSRSRSREPRGGKPASRPVVKKNINISATTTTTKRNPPPKRVGLAAPSGGKVVSKAKQERGPSPSRSRSPSQSPSRSRSPSQSPSRSRSSSRSSRSPSAKVNGRYRPPAR